MLEYKCICMQQSDPSLQKQIRNQCGYPGLMYLILESPKGEGGRGVAKIDIDTSGRRSGRLIGLVCQGGSQPEGQGCTTATTERRRLANR